MFADAVAEHCDLKDSADLAQVLKAYYSDHRVILYPDCSGASRSNANASISAIAILQQAGFEIRAKGKNPDVRDRIQAMNTGLMDGTVRINSFLCPTTARCLEQQAYGPDGKPDKKSGYDHQNDATTYPIAYEKAIRKPLFSLDIGFVS
jgi:hypothetical protein